MYYPDFKLVDKLSETYNIIPVSWETYADLETPIGIYKKLGGNGECFLLESAEVGEKWGRYSFIGKNPFLMVKGAGRLTELKYRDGRTEIVENNPFEVMKELMANYKGAPVKQLPRFTGGAVGFLSYDTVRYFEKLPNIPADDIGIPELHFMFADEIIAFDHFKHKLHIIVNLHVSGQNERKYLERKYNNVIDRIKEIYTELKAASRTLSGTAVPAFPAGREGIRITANINRGKFCENVLRAKEYIENGDVFQVVLSQRFSVETACSPFNVYRALRAINPGPYMYYLDFDGYSIVGSSPEMLVKVEGRRVETRPIAGTRKRGKTAEEDKKLEEELLADEKERAEHIMLVDLARNDIGKVSRFGTVKVDSLMQIERFSHVMHVVSSVSGELTDGIGAFDALASAIPAGTLSGAPKKRAMEIIDELESVKRCQYGGAIGYLGFDGNLDSCIAIRTVVFKGGKAYVQAGAGIVADSVPEMEYEECVNKAAALFRAIEEGGSLE
ncbi:MAG: anthranilate synthase component I [Acetivibrionales bacterium]